MGRETLAFLCILGFLTLVDAGAFRHNNCYSCMSPMYKDLFNNGLDRFFSRPKNFSTQCDEPMDVRNMHVVPCRTICLSIQQDLYILGQPTGRRLYMRGCAQTMALRGINNFTLSMFDRYDVCRYMSAADLFRHDKANSQRLRVCSCLGNREHQHSTEGTNMEVCCSYESGQVLIGLPHCKALTTIGVAMVIEMSNVGDQVNKTVESAKETVTKVGEQLVDLFQGNPFSTPVGRKIELATDAGQLATENWGLNMEICDWVNSSEEAARDATRAIRKRLQTNIAKNNAVVMYTLTVLETCVKNCNHHFHVMICNKDFVLELVKLIGPKFDAPQIIQERVLSLIQAWSDAFKNHPDLQGVIVVYHDLQSKGVVFPAADLDTLAPIITPKRHYEVRPIVEGAQHTPSPEELTKMRKDMEVVNQNLKVFREMVNEIVPGKETEDEKQLLEELFVTCKRMHERVLDLIRVIQNEEVTFELLVANDEFNAVFDKYERFVQNRTNPQPAQEPAVNLMDMDNRNLSEQLASMSVTSASSSYAAGAEAQAEVGLADAVKNKLEEREADEVKQWLGDQEPQETTKPKTKEELENEKL